MPLITDLRPKGWQLLAELPLAQPEQVEALLALQTDGLPDLDRRGQSAFLIARLSYHLALALAASWLQERCAPRLHAKNVALQPVEPASATGSRRRWPGLYLGGAEVDLPPGDHRAENANGWLGETLGPQAEHLFEALIDHLAEVTRLSRAAQWRLVGDSVAMGFLEVGRVLGRPEASQRAALAILKRPDSPLCNKQLHFMTVSVSAEEAGNGRTAGNFRTFVSRGGCCRYYTCESGSICATCVLEPPERQRERLQSLFNAQL